jgi:hypothetical protein
LGIDEQSINPLRHLSTAWILDHVQPVPEFKDPVFAKTSPKLSFSMTENGILHIPFREFLSRANLETRIALIFHQIAKPSIFFTHSAEEKMRKQFIA